MIPFTQFKRPDGRKVQTGIERPAAIEMMAQRLLKQGFVFEIEELMTGMVSMEVTDGRSVIASEICTNGPDVPPTVDRMIRNANERICSDTPS